MVFSSDADSEARLASDAARMTIHLPRCDLIVFMRFENTRRHSRVNVSRVHILQPAANPVGERLAQLCCGSPEPVRFV